MSLTALFAHKRRLRLFELALLFSHSQVDLTAVSMSSKGNPTPPGKGSAQPKTSPSGVGTPFAFSAKAKASVKPRESKLETTQNKFLALLDALNEEEFDQFREFIREELQFGTKRVHFCPEKRQRLSRKLNPSNLAYRSLNWVSQSPRRMS